MKPEIILTVIEGELTGKEFVFEERNICIIGRNNDCYPQIPDDEYHRFISRYHCLLDINPPAIRIRDFGSKNGTFINGEKIGQREDNETPEEAAQRYFPEYDLKNNDTITLSQTVFQVTIKNSKSGTGILPVNENSILPVEENSILPVEKDSKSGTGIMPVEENNENLQPENELENNGDDSKTKETIDIFENPFINVASSSNKRKRKKINIFKRLQNLLQKSLNGNKELKAISNYKLLESIGKGGFGEVYLARHTITNKLVAIKVMLPEVAEDENAVAKFLRETENHRALKHPNIVQLFDYGYSENMFFFTLEYCQEGSLQNYLKNKGKPLTIDEAIPIILQILDGLDYAHNAEIPYVKLADGTRGKGKGLVHRDIKPDNILLTTNEANSQVKIADFGLSKAFDLAGLSGLSVTNGTMGTPVFMPRQQVTDFKYTKPDADVWSVAATFYYLITAKFPRKFNQGDSFYSILRNDPIPIRQQNSNIPQDLAQLIDLALTEKPEIYFKTAKDFKNELLKLI